MDRVLMRTALAAMLGMASLPRLHATGVGTTGAAFLKVGVGGRHLGMAGAGGAAAADDANAIYWNPAGLARIERRSATVSYNALFQDQNQGFLAFAAPLRDQSGAVGIGINYLQVSDIERRDGDTENPDGTFNNQNQALSLSYARKAGDKSSWGASVKFIHVGLAHYAANTFAVDLGAAHRATDRLSLGLSAQNLGKDLGSDPLPMVVRAGAAYHVWKDRFILALDGDAWFQDKRNYASLGAEYWFVPQFALRGGYQAGRSQDKLGGATGLGAGMGMRLEKLSVDYAYVPFGDLGHTHRITLGARF